MQTYLLHFRDRQLALAIGAELEDRLGRAGHDAVALVPADDRPWLSRPYARGPEAGRGWSGPHVVALYEDGLLAELESLGLTAYLGVRPQGKPTILRWDNGGAMLLPVTTARDLVDAVTDHTPWASHALGMAKFAAAPRRDAVSPRPPRPTGSRSLATAARRGAGKPAATAGATPRPAAHPASVKAVGTSAARYRPPTPKLAVLAGSPASVGAKLAVLAAIGTSVAIIMPGKASAAELPSGPPQPRQAGGLSVLPNGKILPPPPPPAPAPPSIASQAQQAGAQQVGGLFVLPNGKIWTPPQSSGMTTVGGVPVGTVPAVRISGYVPDPLFGFGPGGNLAYTADPTGQTGGYLNVAVGVGVGGGFAMAYVPPGSPFFGLQSRMAVGPWTFNGSANFLDNSVAGSAFLDVLTKGNFAAGPGGVVSGPLDPNLAGAPPYQFVGVANGGGISFGLERSLNVGVTFPLPAWLPAMLMSSQQTGATLSPVVGADGQVHIPSDLPIVGTDGNLTTLPPGTTFTAGGYKFVVDPPSDQTQQPSSAPSQDQGARPGTDAASQPGSGAPGQPGSGAPAQPGGDAAGQPGSAAPGQPGSGAAGQPGSAAPGQPGSGAPGQPGGDAAGQPGSAATGQPGGDATGQPGSGAAGQPVPAANGQRSDITQPQGSTGTSGTAADLAAAGAFGLGAPAENAMASIWTSNGADLPATAAALGAVGAFGSATPLESVMASTAIGNGTDMPGTPAASAASLAAAGALGMGTPADNAVASTRTTNGADASLGLGDNARSDGVAGASAAQTAGTSTQGVTTGSSDGGSSAQGMPASPASSGGGTTASLGGGSASSGGGGTSAGSMSASASASSGGAGASSGGTSASSGGTSASSGGTSASSGGTSASLGGGSTSSGGTTSAATSSSG